MTRAICVHPSFERVWPLAAERCRERWPDANFRRLEEEDERPLSEALSTPSSVTQLIALGVTVTPKCAEQLTALEEAAIYSHGYGIDPEVRAILGDGVTIHQHESEGFWGPSVSEFALGLTIAGLRRIPQLHHTIQTDLEPWNYEPRGTPGPGERGHQFGDDDRFTCGTIARKRVRIVGVGNIGSRYASASAHLGADVAAYDPFADEPCFHRAGATRVHTLDALVSDAEIFAPMVPLTDATRGLITAEHIDALPTGTLVVLATRAQIVETDALRERVMNDELALAADVWDGNPGEPLPLDDPLLGRHNVVHTPHAAGRTRDANMRWADELIDRFDG